jgi:hypothetical protein
MKGVVRVIKFFVMLQVFLSGLTRLPVVRENGRVKAAGLLEYALVALISVLIFGAIGFIFRDQFVNLTNRIFSGI